VRAALGIPTTLDVGTEESDESNAVSDSKNKDEEKRKEVDSKPDKADEEKNKSSDDDKKDEKPVDDNPIVLPITKQPNPLAGMWLFVPLWGAVDSNRATFSDFNNPSFPKTTTSVGAIKNMKVWSDGDSENPMISGYSITTSNTSGVEATFSNLTSGSNQVTKDEKDFLEEDVYVRTIYLCRRRPLGEPGGKYFISFLGFGTTKGTGAWCGKLDTGSDFKAFQIPEGWRFAGLYGSDVYEGGTRSIYEAYTNRNRWPINSIGIILAGLETLD